MWDANGPGANPIDVCLATIMTADRVSSFHRLTMAWPWLISVAYLSDDMAKDRQLGLRLLSIGLVAPQHPERIALALVADDGYRCASGRTAQGTLACQPRAPPPTPANPSPPTCLPNRNQAAQQPLPVQLTA